MSLDQASALAQVDRILSYCAQYSIVTAKPPASNLRVPIAEVERALDESPEWTSYQRGPKGDPEDERVWLRVDHPHTPIRLAWEGFRAHIHEHWRQRDSEAGDREVSAWLGSALSLMPDDVERVLSVVGYPRPSRAQKEASLEALARLVAKTRADE